MLNFEDIKKSKESDTIWFLMKTLCTQSVNEVPTWSAYNSLINEAHAKTIYCDYQWYKTVVSLDLQLYSKCIQLQSNLALKTLGKIVDASGLDQTFIEARIYCPNTVEQIKNSKHMKRSFEGFLTLYVSLY